MKGKGCPGAQVSPQSCCFSCVGYLLLPSFEHVDTFMTVVQETLVSVCTWTHMPLTTACMSFPSGTSRS